MGAWRPASFQIELLGVNRGPGRLGQRGQSGSGSGRLGAAVHIIDTGRSVCFAVLVAGLLYI